jgi:hypothetical protein
VSDSCAERFDLVRRFRVNEIFSDPRQRLIAVESVTINHANFEAGCWLQGQIEVVAVIVLDQANRYAMSIDAEPISFESLRKDIPKLDAMLSQVNVAVSVKPDLMQYSNDKQARRYLSVAAS